MCGRWRALGGSRAYPASLQYSTPAGGNGGGRGIAQVPLCPGSKASALYNGDALEEGCDVLIVEGEFDALLAQQELGKQVVVVTAGSAANPLPRRWLDRLKRAGRIYSCLDGDEAGMRATTVLAELLGEQHQTLRLPQGKDITEFVIDYGGDLNTWWRTETESVAPKPVQLSFLDAFAHYSRERMPSEDERPASGTSD